jgi:hypothetical protein
MRLQPLHALSIPALCIILALSLTPSQAEAKGGPFGLGIIGGNPTGITGKYFFGSEDAIDFHLGIGGWGRRNRDIGIYVDYLRHFDLGVRNSVMSMAFYAGIGGDIIFTDNGYCGKFNCKDYRDGDGTVWLAARAPLGINMMFQKVPLELFLEIIPALYIIQYISFDIDLALGLRFYF